VYNVHLKAEPQVNTDWFKIKLYPATAITYRAEKQTELETVDK